VIDCIIDEMRGDLKPKADALIREAVSGIVQRFSDEVARVEGWRKKKRWTQTALSWKW